MYLLTPYDNALASILHGGQATSRTNKRTGLSTLSLFGLQCRYDLSSPAGHFPLLTLRKVFPTSIFAELLWILSGSTKNSDLTAMGSNIWTPWAASSDDLGAIYGHQLRHYGAPYPSTTSSPGFDQLSYLINTIKEDPSSRRILINMWNPAQLHLMALPPCHVLFQLCIDDNRRCTSVLTQRSGDMPIGVPANIQFYSTLTLMICQQCNLTPHEFIHTINDAHIYSNQILGVEEYLSRRESHTPPPDSPTLTLTKASSIHDYSLSSFTITNYNPLPKISIPVAI